MAIGGSIVWLVACWLAFKPDATWILAFVMLAPIGTALTIVWFKQPGTFLYVVDGRLGQRTVTGQRYEIALQSARRLHGTYVALFGVPQPAIVVEDDAGTCLMRHDNARYSISALQEFGAACALDIVLDW